MKTSAINSVFFLGIGGIGMSALARYFKAQNKEVSGYDKTPSPLTRELEKEGIRITYDEHQGLPGSLPDLIVYTPAIPKDNKLYRLLSESQRPFLKRAQVLGEISKEYFTIAVAGTHGKTTTTSIITHLLKYNKLPVIGFVGGICKNYNSNLVLSDNPRILVVEADEFDRSFLTLSPNIAIISSMDADHLDIYGSHDYLKESFHLFASKVKKEGFIILREGLKIKGPDGVFVQHYGINSPRVIRAENIRYHKGHQEFTLKINGTYTSELSTFLPGEHNVLNIIAAAAACYRLGINELKIAEALADYQGVLRRFDVQIKRDDLVYIDDYAHHPEEIKATIQAVRELYPGRKITAVFQPHLYSRTRDFMDDFARELSRVDELVLMDIYPAREQAIPGITSAALAQKIGADKVKLLPADEVVAYLHQRQPEVLLTLGAGDIDRLVAKIREALA